MVINLVRVGHIKHVIYMIITIAHGTKLDPWYKMQSYSDSDVELDLIFRVVHIYI